MNDSAALAASVFVLFATAAISQAPAPAATPPPVFESHVATCPAGPNVCQTPGNCPGIDGELDASAFACFEFKANKTCAEAIAEAPSALNPGEYRAIVDYFVVNKPLDKSCTTTAVLLGAQRTSLFLSEKKGRLQHGLQLLPSISLGIPFIKSDNDTTRALGAAGGFSGLLLRYTPVSYWVSVKGFLGTSTVASTTSLDPAVYPHPALRLWGFGVDFIAGAFGVSFVFADLLGNGLFSAPQSNTNFVQAEINFSDLLILIAGVSNSGSP